MKIKLENILFVLGIAFFFILIIVFLCTGYDKILFDFTINFLDLVSVFITVALAGYVVRVLDKKDAAKKIKRDLILDFYKKLNEELNTRIRQIASGNVKLEFVTNLIRIYRNRNEELYRLATKHGFLQKESDAHKDLAKNMQELNLLLTDTPKIGTIEDGIQFKDGKLFFSIKQTEKIADKLYSIQSSVFEIITEISQADIK